MLSESRFSTISGSDAASIFMEPIHLSSAIAAKKIINEGEAEMSHVKFTHFLVLLSCFVFHSLHTVNPAKFRFRLVLVTSRTEVDQRDQIRESSVLLPPPPDP